MAKRKEFGRRNAPEIKPPAPVLGAPGGLGGPEPLPPSRLRSFAVALTAAGLAALAGLALTQRQKCSNDEWTESKDATCRSSAGGSRSGFHFGWGWGGGTTSAPHGATYGGFGATGASGVHASGGHGGGGE
ncbi:hypothetical protein GJ654_17935 [Rhodoblastus acidophilus]|uniref:Uncharacterized protein n=1 Tax=Rhodoblastus acidophilus TaxID=1074 RepID=A0A6N8DUJ7_RHOAC|nr:hypothetical protein [Rhodoblastus acidophilus]MCW2276200.1 hypothetical protein [Rhodoblastus acidophilus]MTV32863.1 hypothetical protein [Rhodoblastus acidophilus]